MNEDLLKVYQEMMTIAVPITQHWKIDITRSDLLTLAYYQPTRFYWQLDRHGSDMAPPDKNGIDWMQAVWATHRAMVYPETKHYIYDITSGLRQYSEADYKKKLDAQKPVKAETHEYPELTPALTKAMQQLIAVAVPPNKKYPYICCPETIPNTENYLAVLRPTKFYATINPSQLGAFAADHHFALLTAQEAADAWGDRGYYFVYEHFALTEITRKEMHAHIAADIARLTAPPAMKTKHKPPTLPFVGMPIGTQPALSA